MFPPAWRGGEVAASATQLASYEEARCKRIAFEALSRYPIDLVRKNLRAVYFADEIRFFGLSYGGTNSRDTIYIANRGATEGFTDSFLARTFHHEFSSILLRNNPDKFDVQAWCAANRSPYGDGGIQALRNGTYETRYAEKWNVDGFLNQYGASSLEEDFNTFAEALFTGDREFWSLAAKYPRLKDKVTVAIAFYQALDPSLSERFFKALADKN